MMTKRSALVQPHQGEPKPETCARKLRFKSAAKAKQKRLQIRLPELIVYECAVCSGFHLGHPRRPFA
jgi:hypothetical protein